MDGKDAFLVPGFWFLVFRPSNRAPQNHSTILIPGLPFFGLIDKAVEELMVGGPSGGDILLFFDPGQEAVHFGVQVIQVMKEEGFQGLGPFGGPEFVFPVMAENDVLEKDGQILREIGNALDFFIDHFYGEGNVAQKSARVGIIEGPLVGQLGYFTQVMENGPGEEKFLIDSFVPGTDQENQLNDGKGMLQQAAEENVVDRLGRRGHFKFFDQLIIAKKSFQESA
jgi:hypothetical protein